jgi:hypothetical protein
MPDRRHGVSQGGDIAEAEIETLRPDRRKDVRRFADESHARRVKAIDREARRVATAALSQR